MAYGADYVQSPRYGTIRIGEMAHFNENTDNVRTGYYPQTTMTPTIVLYENILPNMTDMQPIFNTVWTNFVNMTFNSMEDVVAALQSEDYHKVVTDIEWIWGAPDVGGLGVCKSAADSYELVYINGYRFNNDVYYPNASSIHITYPRTITISDQTPSDIDTSSPQNLSIPPAGTYKTGIFIMTYGNYDYENNNIVYNYPVLNINACALIRNAQDSYVARNTTTGQTFLSTATFTDAGVHIADSWRHQFYNSLPINAKIHPIWEMRKEEQWSINSLYPYWANAWLQGAGAPNVDGTSIFGGESATIDPLGNPYEVIDDSGGSGGTGGGGGSQSRYSEETLPEGVPALTLLNSGFVKLYNPTLSEVNQFASFLFSGITEDMSAVIKRMMANPIDYILALNMIHLPLQTTTAETIGFCGISSGVKSAVVTEQYYQIEYRLDIEEFWNTALDYSSYTKCRLYVPYCGIYDINIDEIQNGTLWLRYVVDVVSGSVIAFVGTRRVQKDGTVLRSTLYQYNGNCILAMPVSQTNWQNTFSSILNIASMAIAPSPSTVGGMANDIMSQKVSVQKSGSISANFGYLGKQTPYVILERPELSIPVDYGKYYGYPANHLVTLANCKGFTAIDTDQGFIADDISGITPEEADELKTLLSNGVYFNTR